MATYNSNSTATGNTHIENDSLVTGYSNSQSSAVQQTLSGGQNVGQGVKTVVGIFNSHDDAEKAVNALRSQGFGIEEINIVSKNKSTRNRENQYFEDDVTDGALTGGTLGGIGGLLLGAGALAIPGVGPVLAAGPIAAALSGAVAGGIAGGLIDWGIPAEAGKHYEEQVAKGGILTVIRTSENKVQQAAQVLRQYGAKDVETHSIK
ncbi:MAG TPA: hypothetical protein PKA28_01180 [Methylomusa anaerophila]|uniref:General stress protein 17M-like domain-containing protein n=1 Tax=Methylomusa anaerophila TaxID=1930071 RepID=A0A348APX6_9FIRM|nr:general stress protein [Methylomusa anaerophila]BBB93124.1 hypothetical protein MAMMFC1_03833 [Methylomusa anaerophila]HML87043.1 hypothetical protein [Methylomusa anaerophila]